MPRAERDPQVDLVKRYARILRSAPAEALRAQTAPTPLHAAAEKLSAPRFAPAERTAAARAAEPELSS
jgi:hypothetical protein